MATAAAASAAEPETDPKVGPEAEGEEDEAKGDRRRRKVLTRAVAAAAYKTMGPAWDQRQEEGMSESDGDEEFAMASSAESSPGEDEWEYDEEEEKNQLEIERLEEQVRPGVGSEVPLPPRSPGVSLLLPGPWREVMQPPGQQTRSSPRSSQRLGRLPGAARALSPGILTATPGGAQCGPRFTEETEALGGGTSLAHGYTSCKWGRHTSHPKAALLAAAWLPVGTVVGNAGSA